AVAAHREVVLADLVALGEVGVEVVLAVELGELLDLAVERHGRGQEQLDRPAVDDRQAARQPEADGAGVGVRGLAEVVGAAAAEHLGPRRQLDMDLHPDHGFPVGLGVDAHSGATSARTPLAISWARPTWRARSSRNWGEITCRPTGRPSSARLGRLSPGSPARSAPRVRTS